jgi:hypothetical protein
MSSIGTKKLIRKILVHSKIIAFIDLLVSKFIWLSLFVLVYMVFKLRTLRTDR